MPRGTLRGGGNGLGTTMTSRRSYPNDEESTAQFSSGDSEPDSPSPFRHRSDLKLPPLQILETRWLLTDVMSTSAWTASSRSPEDVFPARSATKG
ncbi:unnamed protein product [Cochlearia groenlandica]